MLNTDFGLVNQILGTNIAVADRAQPGPVLGPDGQPVDGLPVLLPRLLGCATAIPEDLKEAAFVDGASSRHAFRTVVLPLLLVATAPLLVTTFAFNFNNYTLIELLTQGGPFPGALIDGGSTDLLINFTFRRRSTNQPAARPGVGHRDGDLRDRRNGVGVRVPPDQATRGDRTMSMSDIATKPATPTVEVAKPLKADRMPFGRWLRLVGWRHVVAIIFVVWALFPVVLRRQPGVLRRQHPHRGVPAGAHGLRRRSCIVPTKFSLDNFTSC